MSGFPNPSVANLDLESLELADLESGSSAVESSAHHLEKLVNSFEISISPLQYNRTLCHLPTDSKAKAGGIKKFVVFHPTVTQEGLQMITSKFVPRDSDVWVVTYPEARGTGDASVAGGATALGGLIVGQSLGVVGDLMWIENLVSSANGDSELSRINALPINAPRVFKSHAPFEYIQQWTTDKSKVLYLSRNPKDLAYCDYEATRCNNLSAAPPLTLNHYLKKIFVRANSIGGDWWDHALTFSSKYNYVAVTGPEEGSPDLFTLSYENMYANMKEGVEGIRSFVRGEDKPNEAKVTEIMSAISATKFEAPGQWAGFFTVVDSDLFDRVHTKRCAKSWGNDQVEVNFGYQKGRASKEDEEAIALLQEKGDGYCVVM
jgi:hypothetical protein